MSSSSRQSLPAWRAPLLTALGILVLVAATTRLLRAAVIDSQDFRVYWTALTAWLDGRFPYLIRAEDQGFVFKYPPWMLPLLLPFHWLPFEFSKAVWAALEWGAIAVSFRSLLRAGLARRSVVLTTLLFWYLWLAHFYAGQLTIFLLATALMVTERPLQNIRSWSLASLGVLFSAKVISVFSLLGFGRRLFARSVIASGLGILAGLHVTLWALTPSGGTGIGELYAGWIAAAGSGAAGLGAEVIRGTGNHGFTAVILRVLDPEALHPNWDLGISLLLAIAVGLIWQRLSRGLSFEDRWAGWLALGVVVHPLAWHHSFVMAYPLAARALDASSEASSEASGDPTRNANLPTRKRLRSEFWLALLGIALIGLLVPQVVGKTIVKPFELCGNKSWGVIALCFALVRARRREKSR